IDRAQVGISAPDFAIAETGSIVEITTDDSMRLVSTLPAVHIAVLPANKILASLSEAAIHIRDAFERNHGNCVVTFISGPSRSGDIEMKLTLGVHGPKASHVVI